MDDRAATYHWKLCKIVDSSFQGSSYSELIWHGDFRLQFTEGDGRERSSGSGGSNAKPVAGDGNNNPPATSTTRTT